MAGNFKRGDVSLANWRTSPFSSFAFSHVEEFVPMAIVTASGGDTSEVAGSAILDGVEVPCPDGGAIGIVEHLARSHTDALMVLKDGAPAALWHAPHHDPARPHVIFSVSKSVTGMLAGIAAGDGLLDPNAPVRDYVPVPDDCAYAGARVRDLLDMTVALDFSEEYLDEDGAFDRYRRAMLWNLERSGAKTETMREFLGSLGGTGAAHGRRFFYASPNTDMLGLVIEAATGKRYHDYLGERLWRPMGAAGSAWVTVDRAGAARAAGGICVTAADLASFGQLVLDGGRTGGGKQVVPRDWIDDMRENGDARAWKDGNFAEMYVDGSYRSCWYNVGDERGSFCAIGIHGQWIWVDPTSRVVIAKVSSQPEASDDAMLASEIAALGAIARAI